MDAKATCQICFLLVLVIGLGCIFFGPALDAAVKAAKLDAVLSPEELTNKKCKAERKTLLIEPLNNIGQYGWDLARCSSLLVSLDSDAATMKRTVQPPHAADRLGTGTAAAGICVDACVCFRL